MTSTPRKTREQSDKMIDRKDELESIIANDEIRISLPKLARLLARNDKSVKTALARSLKEIGRHRPRDVAFELASRFKEIRVLGPVMRLSVPDRKELLRFNAGLAAQEAERVMTLAQSFQELPTGLVDAFSWVLPTWFGNPGGVDARSVVPLELGGLSFVRIPRGQFLMGARDLTEPEYPPHLVSLSSFWICETPVTNAVFDRYLSSVRSARAGKHSTADSKAENMPVVEVDWLDARGFCSWFSQEYVCEASLPTEAQWEYAARGTDGRPYPWGEAAPDHDRAHFGGSILTGGPVSADYLPAGAGPFGTLGQAGNVWEWCLDAWEPRCYANRSQTVALDPVVDDEGNMQKIVRGGSFASLPSALRAEARFAEASDTRSPDIGFRPVIGRFR